LRARFWLQCVRALQKDLASQGSGLTVCLGKPEEVLSSLPSGSEVMCQAEPVSIEQTDVEDFVEEALKKSGGALRREWGAMSLYQRGDLPFRIKDQMPGSYSGLGTALGWKDIWTNTEQWEGATPVRAPVAAPAKFPDLPAGGLTLPGAIPEAVLADDAAVTEASWVLGRGDRTRDEGTASGWWRVRCEGALPDVVGREGRQ